MAARLEIKVAKSSSTDEQHKNLEKALKVLKNKFFKTGMTKELRDRKEFLKPSVIKRLEKEKAKRKNKFNFL
jgi:small subunit ribosomal protein S21